MLVYRLLYTFAIGLTLGCALLLVPSRPVQVVPQIAIELPQIAIDMPPSIGRTRPPAIDVTPATIDVAPPTIIDVAPGISAAQLALAIRIAPDEYIVGVDGVAVQGDLDAGVRLASLHRQTQQFLDLQVRGPAGERRIVVLMH